MSQDAVTKAINDIKDSLDDSPTEPSQIFMFFASEVPDGYLELAGQSIDSKYKKLREEFGDTLPDLRGRFPRASGNKGGKPKNTQDFGMPQLKGRVSLSNKAEGVFYRSNDALVLKPGGIPTFDAVFDSTRVIPEADELRPDAFSALFCVKAQ